MANLFTNRIVGYTTKRASQLTANPLNWRKHPKRQRDAVQASLRELGWIAAVVENVRTGFLVDGHERVWQALADNDAEVPVLEVDLSEAEERLALATFDPITYMAETDAAALDALLREVQTGDAALQAMLAELASIDVIGFGGVDGESREESVWNKMTSEANYRKFEFGEFRLLLPAAVHDRLWQDAESVDNKAEWLERVILSGLEHADDSPD